MFIAGTVRNTLNLTKLDSKWQQKKQQNPTRKSDEMTPEQLQLQRFQEELQKQRENKTPEINTKLLSGGKLTREEIEYLRKNDPQKLKEYEEIQHERESYKKQLKSCKSKEEVERLKMTRMGQYMSQAKSIASDSCIPKSEKYKLMVKLLAEATGVAKEHIKFTQSLMYAQLPEEDEDAKKKGNGDTEELPKETADTQLTDVTAGSEKADELEQLRIMAEALAPESPASAPKAESAEAAPKAESAAAPQAPAVTFDVKV